MKNLQTKAAKVHVDGQLENLQPNGQGTRSKVFKELTPRTLKEIVTRQLTNVQAKCFGNCFKADELSTERSMNS